MANDEVGLVSSVAEESQPNLCFRIRKSIKACFDSCFLTFCYGCYSSQDVALQEQLRYYRRSKKIIGVIAVLSVALFVANAVINYYKHPHSSKLEHAGDETGMFIFALIFALAACVFVLVLAVFTVIDKHPLEAQIEATIAKPPVAVEPARGEQEEATSSSAVALESLQLDPASLERDHESDIIDSSLTSSNQSVSEPKPSTSAVALSGSESSADNKKMIAFEKSKIEASSM